MEGNQTNLRHIVGIIPVAGLPLDFNFRWHDSLIPLAPNFTAIERAVLECASAGCSSIYLVLPEENIRLFREMFGEWAYDPKYYWKPFTKFPKDERKHIPIYYIRMSAKDTAERGCLAWGIVVGADTARRVAASFSEWMKPEKFYIAFPYGAYSPYVPQDVREEIWKERFFFSYEGKTALDGEYMGFTLTASEIKEAKLSFLKRATMKHKTLSDFKVDGKWKEVRPLEERYSGRFFTLDKFLEPIKIDGTHTHELKNYENISSWEGYTNYIKSEGLCITRQKADILLRGSQRRELQRVGDTENGKG